MNDLRVAPPDVTDPDVDVRVPPAPPMVRRRAVAVAVAVAVVVAALVGGGGWWHRQVSGDPGLEFYGGPNVFRDVAASDRAGIRVEENMAGVEVGVAFVADGRLYAHFGLFNGGGHDLRIEAAPSDRFFYWGFERMSVAVGPDDGLVGVADAYEPFRPFTLRRGETREVRLEFRLAGCDPAALQPGGFSTRRALPLRYRLLGVTRTAPVPFRDTVLALGAHGPCADPLVDPES